MRVRCRPVARPRLSLLRIGGLRGAFACRVMDNISSSVDPGRRGARSRDPLTGERRTLSRPLRLRRVTLFVPEGYAEGLRQFARELRDRQRREPDPATPNWRTISPTTELAVNLEYRTRCAIRDTGANGTDRFHWTVTVLGQPHPVAAGRTADLALARSLTALAFRGYVDDWRRLSEGQGDDSRS